MADHDGYLTHVQRVAGTFAVLRGGPADGCREWLTPDELRRGVRHVAIPQPADARSISQALDDGAPSGPAIAEYVWHGEALDDVAIFRWNR